MFSAQGLSGTKGTSEKQKNKKQREVEVADDCCATTNNFDIIQKKRSERERLMSHFLPFLVFFFPGKVRPLQRQDPDDRHGWRRRSKWAQHLRLSFFFFLVFRWLPYRVGTCRFSFPAFIAFFFFSFFAEPSQIKRHCNPPTAGVVANALSKATSFERCNAPSDQPDRVISSKNVVPNALTVLIAFKSPREIVSYQ